MAPSPEPADSAEPTDQESAPVAGMTRRDNDVAPPGVGEDNAVGLLRLSYRTAARHLATLSMPGALLYVPAAIAVSAAIFATVGRGGRIVNGDITVWTYSHRPVAVVCAALVVGYAVEIVALAATVFMAAGDVLGRPVEPRTALGAAVRRAPALAVLGLVALLVLAAVAAAGVATAAKTGAVWMGVVVIVAVSPGVLWLAVALPIALLDGRGTLGAIGRAVTLTRLRRWQTSIVVAVGVIIVPGLVVAGLRWAVSPFDGITHTLLGQVVLGAAGVFVVPFQAATLVVVALNQRYPFSFRTTAERPLDLAAVAGRLPVAAAQGASGRRRLGALALLPLPGLLYTGYIVLNPLDLQRTSDHVLRDDFGRQPVALHLLGGDRPAEVSGPTGGSIGMRVCASESCHGNRLYDYGRHVYLLKMATATLPDGAVAAVTWSGSRPNESKHKDGEWVLRLFRCGVKACGPAATVNTAHIVEFGGPGEEFGYGAAVTPAAGQGIVIAAIEPTEKRRDSVLRIIRCGDPRCATPTAITATRLPFRILGLFSRPVAVAVGHGDRPVVAYEDYTTGAITLVSCDTAVCAHPRINREKLPTLPRDTELHKYIDGVDIAVPADDRPVVAYRDGRTGAAMLRRCRTPDCAETDTVSLTGPGLSRPWPALDLDRAGRPIVATYDLVRHQAVLIACHDAGCARRTQVPLGQISKGPGYLDLAIGRDGDARVLWSDEAEYLLDSEGPLHLTICRDSRCRP